jgi:hypothetical protein
MLLLVGQGSSKKYYRGGFAAHFFKYVINLLSQKMV